MAYILFEDEKLDFDFVFTDQQLADFKGMWNGGISVQEIAKKLRRKPSEIVLLVFDHAERNLIKKRQNGVYGL